MKNYKKFIAGVLTITGTIGACAYGAYAYQGDYTKKGPNYSEQRHVEMTNIFNKGDYNAWKEKMQENVNSRGGRGGRVLEVVNEDNFSKFVEARNLALSGDIAGADKIREELGLRTSNGERVGKGYGRRGGGKNIGARGENRGKNLGGNFVDKNGDGICDNFNK